MNISLPEGMKAFVDEQVAVRGYGTSSEYVRDLIRKEQDRESLRSLLLDGARAPIAAEPTPAYFDSLRARASGRVAKASRTEPKTKSRR